jgi:hypothetical protein
MTEEAANDRRIAMDDLKERVEKFLALELPGQPMMMHMGTSSLVQDLWREVRQLRERLARYPKEADRG